MGKLLKSSFLLVFFVSGFSVFAQSDSYEDTVAVFVCHYKTSPDTSGFLVLSKGENIFCRLHDSTKVKGNINRFTTDSIMIDSVNYALKDISTISTFSAGKRALLGVSVSIVILSCAILIPVIADAAIAGIIFGSLCSLGCISRKTWDINSMRLYIKKHHIGKNQIKKNSHEAKTKSVISDFYTLNFERPPIAFDSVYANMKTVDYYNLPLWISDSNILKKRHKEFDCKHSISMGVFDLLANEISLTYGYRINRRIGLDFSPGIYFQTNQPSPVVPFIPYERKIGGFSYSPNDFKGYQLKLTLKCYFPKRPNRYVGFSTFFRDINYSHRMVCVYSYPSNYLIDNTREQSEHSYTLGWAILIGWQTTLKNNFTTDFFIGIGEYYRWGYLTTYGHSGYENNNSLQYFYNYPHNYKPYVFLPSIQVGMKIGCRFGKLKK
jgi:hypothetical protein